MVGENSYLNFVHACCGDWRVKDFDQHITIGKMLSLIGSRDPVRINFSEVCHKKLSNFDCPRYINCDTSFPCIAAEGAPNPEGKKYRVCDGKHRIHKLKNEGESSGLFYVLTADEFNSLL